MVCSQVLLQLLKFMYDVLLVQRAATLQSILAASLSRLQQSNESTSTRHSAPLSGKLESTTRLVMFVVVFVHAINRQSDLQEQQTGRPALMGGSGNPSGGYNSQDHREEPAGCCGNCVVL